MGGVFSVCGRRKQHAAFDFSTEADDYEWDGLSEDRIEAYADAKDGLFEKFKEQSKLNEYDSGWLQKIPAQDCDPLKALLMRRAIALVHVLGPIEEERHSMSRLHSRGFLSPGRWHAFESADAMCVAELRDIQAEAAALGMETIIPYAVRLYNNHGLNWPPGSEEQRELPPPEHPCPPDFPVGCKVLLKEDKDEERHDAQIGVVVSGVEGDPEAVKVKFNSRTEICSISELQKTVCMDTPPEPFQLGMKVRWKGSDEDIPAGEVGEVAGGTKDGHVRVKFKKGTWSFPPSEILDEHGKPLAPLQMPKEEHPDATEIPQHQLSFVLAREATKILGLELSAQKDEGIFVIAKIVEDSLASKYNAEQQDPASLVMEGDHLMAVADAGSPDSQPVSKDTEAMLELIKNQDVKSLRFFVRRVLGPRLRFKVGSRVKANCGDEGWLSGSVVDHWAVTNPLAPPVPYVIMLETSQNVVFAPKDHDDCIKKGDPRFKVGESVMANTGQCYSQGTITGVEEKKTVTQYAIKLNEEQGTVHAPADLDVFVRRIARFKEGDKVLARHSEDGYVPGTVMRTYHPKWVYAIELQDGSVVTAPSDVDAFVKKA